MPRHLTLRRIKRKWREEKEAEKKRVCLALVKKYPPKRARKVIKEGAE